MKEQNFQDSAHFNAYALCLSIFVAALVISQFLAAKLVMMTFPIVGTLVFPAGVLAYAITYLCTDVISEIWGKKRAAQSVLFGFISTVVIFLLIWVAKLLPAQPEWQLNAAFHDISAVIMRVTVAGLVAYLISQYHDVWMYHLLKKLTGGRFLWLRNTVSTSLSQFFDTVIFITLAFYGKMDTKILVSMVIGQFTVKVMLAILDTPFVYLIVGLMKKRRPHL